MRKYLVTIMLNDCGQIDFVSYSRDAKRHLATHNGKLYGGTCIVKDFNGVVLSECRYDKEKGFYYVHKED